MIYSCVNCGSFANSTAPRVPKRCRPCTRAYRLAWKRKYNLRYNSMYRSKNIERLRDYSASYRAKHRQRIIAYDKRIVQERRLRVLTHYGGNPPHCSCCHESNIKFLTLDHREGGGHEHVRQTGGRGHKLYRWIEKNGYPPIFQVLCFNCNCGRALNNGVCPHKGGMLLVPQSIVS